MKMLTNEIKGKPMYPLPLYLHFLAVWTKFDTFYFQIFCKKGNLLTRAERKTFIYYNKIENKDTTLLE